MTGLRLHRHADRKQNWAGKTDRFNSVASRQTKLISFRVSEQEYGSIHDVCQSNGMRTVSELARAGLQLIMQKPSTVRHEVLVARLTDLEARLQMLTTEVRNSLLRTAARTPRSTAPSPKKRS